MRQVVHFVDVLKISKGLDAIGRNFADGLLLNPLENFGVVKFFIPEKDNPFVGSPSGSILLKAKCRRVEKETFELSDDLTGLDKGVVKVFHFFTSCYF